MTARLDSDEARDVSVTEGHRYVTAAIGTHLPSSQAQTPFPNPTSRPPPPPLSLGSNGVLEPPAFPRQLRRFASSSGAASHRPPHLRSRRRRPPGPASTTRPWPSGPAAPPAGPTRGQSTGRSRGGPPDSTISPWKRFTASPFGRARAEATHGAGADTNGEAGRAAVRVPHHRQPPK